VWATATVLDDSKGGQRRPMLAVRVAAGDDGGGHVNDDARARDVALGTWEGKTRVGNVPANASNWPQILLLRGS